MNVSVIWFFWRHFSLQSQWLSNDPRNTVTKIYTTHFEWVKKRKRRRQKNRQCAHTNNNNKNYVTIHRVGISFFWKQLIWCNTLVPNKLELFRSASIYCLIKIFCKHQQSPVSVVYFSIELKANLNCCKQSIKQQQKKKPISNKRQSISSLCFVSLCPPFISSVSNIIQCIEWRIYVYQLNYEVTTLERASMIVLDFVAVVCNCYSFGCCSIEQ